MTGKLLGVSAVAREVGLHKSSVSRYLDQHPELNHASPGESPKIDLEEFKAYRGGNLDPDVMGAAEARGLDLGQPGAADSERRSSNGESRGGPEGPSQLTQAKTALSVTQARLRHLEFAERVGQVVPRQEVEDSAFDVGAVFRQALKDRRDRLGAQLATIADPREAVEVLRSADERLLEQIIERLTGLVETNEEDDVVAA